MKGLNLESVAPGVIFTMIFFLFYVIIEVYIYNKRNIKFSFEEITASGYSGMIFVLVATSGLNLLPAVGSEQFIFDNISFFSINKIEWWDYIIMFIIIDFVAYWTHRLFHRVNYFWSTHRMHHSGEVFNAATALRQDIFPVINIFFLFYAPFALLGYAPGATPIALVALHKFFQFWYHTESIKKLGFLEHIIVTPTSHRVHHSMNKAYIDKNFGAVFIFWDKMFGTYQEELETERPVVGDTRPSRSYNVLYVATHHFYRMAQDAWRTNNNWDKIRVWFMPTGWRPEDVKEKYPILSISDPIHYNDKYIYSPAISNGKKLIIMNHFRFFIYYIFVMLFFFFAKEINATNSLFSFIENTPLFVFALIITGWAYSTFMDRSKWSWVIELPLFVLALYVVGVFFSNNINNMPIAFLTIAIYHIISFAVTIYFCLQFSKENKEDAFSLEPFGLTHRV